MKTTIIKFTAKDTNVNGKVAVGHCKKSIGAMLKHRLFGEEGH